MDALTKPKRKTSFSASTKSRKSPYPDLHDHVRALEKAGQLIRVDRPINKDTEMHPLVRWQFRGGIEERDRKAFLFTNVVDSKKRKYDIPVAVGVLAANREIYRIGIGCRLDEIDERWVKAAQNPIPPRIVGEAPCHDIVITGKALDKPGNGLDGIPLPISTPGWDIAPYATLSQYITKDPDTGIQNLGNYRGHVKAPRRLGMNPSLELRLHVAAIVAEILDAGVGNLGDVLRQRRIGRDVPAGRRNRQRNAVEPVARLVQGLAGDHDVMAWRLTDNARRDRVLRRLDPAFVDFVEPAADANAIDFPVRGEHTDRDRNVVFALLAVDHVGEQECLAILLLDAAAELPAHQRVHFGVLVDRPVDGDEQAGLIECLDVIVQVRR